VVVCSFVDDRRSEVLRVTVEVDDGGWSAYMPLTDALLVEPDAER
jgi:hypothetical protein